MSRKTLFLQKLYALETHGATEGYIEATQNRPVEAPAAKPEAVQAAQAAVDKDAAKSVT